MGKDIWVPRVVQKYNFKRPKLKSINILKSIFIVRWLENTWVIRNPCTRLLFASLTFLGKFPLALVGKDVDTPNKNSHMNEFVRCSSLLQGCRSQGAGVGGLGLVPDSYPYFNQGEDYTHHITEGFICTLSLLISLSITLRSSKFRNQFTISSKYFDMVCYLKRETYSGPISFEVQRNDIWTDNIQSFEMPF